MKSFLIAFLLTASLVPALEVHFEWVPAYPAPLEYRLYLSAPEEERLLATVTGDITRVSASLGVGKHRLYVRAIYEKGQNQSATLTEEIELAELLDSDDLGQFNRVVTFERLKAARRFYKVDVVR